MLRLSQYEMNVKYMTQKCVPVANCLSRLISPNSAQEDETLNLQIADLGMEPVNIDWDNIRRFTMNNPTLVRLARVIQYRWPEYAKELEDDVKVNFPHRFVLHIVNGIIFIHNRIVVPIGLQCGFLVKLHDNHMGITKTRLLAHSLVYWPNWNSDVDHICSECITCKENQQMPPNIPKFQVSAKGPGEVYGCDFTDINGKQHLVLVDYFSCCIFESKLANLTSLCVVKALKDIFCDLGSPDKLVTDNARYFVSEEFTKFTMDWSIQHVTSSPRFSHGNAHVEKAVGIIKQIYERCQDVKLGLLLLKTMPITNQDRGQCHAAPCNYFYGCTLKAHLPIYWSLCAENTCTLGAKDSAKLETGDVLSKY